MRRRRSSLEPTGQESIGLDINEDGNSEEKPLKLKKMTPTVASSSQSRNNASLQNYRRFYFLHTALVLVILTLGMIHNGGDRKYIPVNPKELYNLIEGTPEIDSCRKAYVNVHSSTINEEFSAICCFDSVESNGKTFQSNLCNPRIPIMGLSTQQLPFARRLTRLTEAWVLPLLPILIRLLYQLVILGYASLKTYRKQHNNMGDTPLQREATSISTSRASSSSLSSNASTSISLIEKSDVGSPSATDLQPSTPSHTLVKTTLKRLLFYLLLLNLRGWGLYIGANAVEDYIILPWLTGNTVVSPMRTDSMSDEEHDLHYSGNNEPDCWYKDILKAHHKTVENDGHSDCYGRPFDFSDHVVLFLAHYLPVFVMEMSLYFSHPFLGSTMTEKSATKQGWAMGMIWDTLHAFLFLYLHAIVLHALYTTTVYFHTPAEILVGYIVSLGLQLPTMYMMCSTNTDIVREYLGLPSEGKTMSDKGD